MDDYLPPIVVEILTRARGFEQGVGKVKADMASAAGAIEGDALAMGGAVERETKKVEGHTQGFTRRFGSMLSGLGNMLAATPLGAPFSRMGSEMQKAETKGKGLSNELAGIGKTAAFGLTAGLAVGGFAAVKLGANFQQAMTQLITGAGEARKNIDLVSSGILAMAGSVGQTPMELAKGMYMIESAGYHGAQGLQVLKAAAEGAATGNASMASVADVVTSALHDYGIKADHANQVTSAMIQTVALGKTHLQDLSLAMGNVMPVASALGVKFQDVTGAMSTMTVSGMSARRASMSLAFMLRAFGAPGSTAVKALTSVGLTAQQLHDTLANKGLPAALDLVTTAIGDHFPKGSVEGVAALKAITGGAAGMNTALMLTGRNMGTFTSNAAKIGTVLHGSGREVQGFSLTNKDMKFQLDKAKAAIEAVATGLGQWLIPMVTKAAMAVAGAVQWLMKHKTVAIALAAVIGGILAVAIGAWVASMAAAVAAMSPIILIIGAVVAAGILLVTQWKTIWHAVSTAVSDAVHAVTGVINDVVNWIKDHWKIIAVVLLAPLMPIVAAFILFKNQIITIFSTVEQAIIGAWNAISGAFTTALNTITGLLSAIPAAVGNIATSIVTAFTSLPGDIAGALSAIGSAVTSAIGNAMTAIGNMASTIASAGATAASDFISGMGNLASGLASTIGNALNNAGTTVINFFKALPGKTLSAIKTLGSDIAGFFTQLPGKISGAVSSTVNTVVSFFSSIPGKIVGVLTGLGRTIGGIFSGLWHDISGPLGSLIGDITGALAGIGRGVANAASGIGSGIWDGLKAVINTAIGLIDDFIGVWDSIHVNIPLVGNIGLPHIGKIPYLAEGGIVTQPTLAVVGEAGPEAVVPLPSGGLAPGGSLPQSFFGGPSSGADEGGGGGPQISMPMTIIQGPSANEVADEVLWKLRPYLNAA